jgi:hypothetical protein
MMFIKVTKVSQDPPRRVSLTLNLTQLVPESVDPLPTSHPTFAVHGQAQLRQTRSNTTASMATYDAALHKPYFPQRRRKREQKP